MPNFKKDYPLRHISRKWESNF